LGAGGNAYVTGYTFSTDFPTTPGAFQTTCPGACAHGHPFVTEFNPTGSALLYSTYLGGSNIDGAGRIAIDAAGDAYVSGETFSADFPVTPGAFQTTCGGGCANDTSDAFVTELNPSGSALVYSTYIGGSALDGATGIVLDAAGDAYITGQTYSNDFPTTPGAFQTTCVGSCANNASDAFMAELNSTGSALVYSTHLGGSSYDSGTAIAVDATGGTYVTGDTASTDFPITPGAFQPACAGGCSYANAFVTKFVPGDQVWPLALNFGSQPIGVASTAQNTALTNSGTTTLAITGITFTGTNSGDFSEKDNCGTSLPAGGSCTIAVTFTPTGTGARNATLNITDSAANSPQQVALSGTGSLIVTLLPSNLNFGSQGLGSTSQPQPVTLGTNGTLIINSIFANPPFAQTNNCGNGLPAGGSCTINVTFSPQVLGPQNGVLTVTDDATGSPQTVGLAGTGVSPVVLNPSSLNFGNQTVGATSAPMMTTLTNVGIVAVTITSIVITGPNSSAFAQMNNCSTTIAPNGTCVISVTFTPTMLQSYNASLAINDSAAGSPQVVPLSGVGNGPILMISPSSIIFPEQYVGTSGLPQSVTLTNNGNSPLIISSVTTSPTDFGSLNACGNSLSVGSSCSIGVFFDPTTGGTRNGTLSIADNAAGSPQMVPLTGMGQDFSMSSSSSSATVSPGQSANFSVAITPVGGFKQIVALSCSGGPAGSTCTVPASITLNGSSSMTVTVTVATAGSVGLKLGPSTSGGRWLAFGLFGLPMIVGLVGIGAGRHGRTTRCVFLLLAIAVMSLVPSCGGGSMGTGGTYPVTVTGNFTSGKTTLTHTTTLTLIVQ